MRTGPEQPFVVEQRPPWLVVSYPRKQRMLSWAPYRAGYQRTSRVIWLQVSDADLPLGVDPLELLRERLAAAELDDAVGLLTSSELAEKRTADVQVEDVSVTSLLTFGLTNAEQVGTRRPAAPIDDVRPLLGTINLLCSVSVPLTDAAMLEAISIATEARTAAIIAGDHQLEPGVVATGTGTDCIVLACPEGPERRGFAGLHTAVGEAVGASVLEATSLAMRDWRARYG